MDYIKQEEYLLDLAEELKYLSPKDATKVLQFYQTKINNAIDYGEKEEDVLKKLPSPEQVAKDAYESHSVNYLEIRKRQFKRKKIFNNIVDAILTLVVLVSFLVIMYFLGSSILKMGALIWTLFTTKTGLDQIVSSISVFGYLIIVVLASIYVIDLFIIILSHFLGNLIKLKDEQLHRKIFTFTITGYIEEKTKHPKLQLKIIISVFVVTVILMVVSYCTKGYLYNSLNGIPSNQSEYILDSNINSIDLSGYKANIYLKKSDSTDFKIVHQYEFSDELEFKTSKDRLVIKIEDSSSYDIFDLLKEPVQNIIIYVPEETTKSLNIKLYDGIFDATDVYLNNVVIDIETKGTISFVNTKTSTISVNGYDIAFAIQNTTANEVSYISTKGQFVINDKTILDKLSVNNNQSPLKFEDSVIKNITLKNSSGNIDFINVTGESVNYVSKTSQNNFTDCIFNEMSFEISNTCSLALTRVIGEKLNVKCEDQSYVIVDYVRIKDILIDAVSSNVFLTGVGVDYPTEKENYYNTYECLCNVSVKNKYNDSKTEITDCNILDLNIIQEQGYFICKKSLIKTGVLNLVKCNIVDLINLDGEVIDLYLNEIQTSMTIDADEKNDLVYKVRDWDAISSANIIRNEKTTNFIVEAD